VNEPMQPPTGEADQPTNCQPTVSITTTDNDAEPHALLLTQAIATIGFIGVVHRSTEPRGEALTVLFSRSMQI